VIVPRRLGQSYERKYSGAAAAILRSQQGA
jgi:hypothetical protein